MIITIVLLSALLSLFYFFLFSYFQKGWDALPEFVPTNNEPLHLPTFSIIIPARNEEKNILACLESIVLQNYPPELFEVIVLDDFSEDDTYNVIRDFAASHPLFSIRILKMDEFPPATNSFKKAAIQKGIEISNNTWIITTDADCTRGHLWLKTIAAYIQEKNPVLISAPVSFRHTGKYFQEFQTLEFMGLIAIGASCIEHKTPTMCNGANLIYRKEAFDAIGGFKGIDNIASGDDELLMHKLHEKYPQGIHFLKNKEAIATTNPCFSLSEFIAQRRRWVSKSTHYNNKRITLILAMSYLYNLSFPALFVIHFLFPPLFFWLLLVLGIKVAIEYRFYRRIAGFFNQQFRISKVISSSMLHIIYVLFIGIYGNFGRYNWKGRKTK